MLSWHIVISGFLQREGAPNGMLRLWRELHQEFAAPHTAVEMRTWNEGVSSLAEKIWVSSQGCGATTRVAPVVRVYAYSWGGAAAVKLAQALAKRSLRVRHLVLCDAVYRHAYWAGNWRAFWPFARLRVPPNVDRVDWFRQANNLPMGHEVVADDPAATDVCYRGLLPATHQYMDDHPKFHRLAMEVAR